MIASYTFFIPENFWNSTYGISHIEHGHSPVVSGLCNPNFVDKDGYDCEDYFENGYCDDMITQLIFYSVWNENGILETSRQCPQCGCGADGAVNLNNLYADEVAGLKNVSNDKRYRKNM